MKIIMLEAQKKTLSVPLIGPEIIVQPSTSNGNEDGNRYYL